MPDHIVSAFDNELKDLASKLSEMGGLAERMISDSMQALVRMDVELANDIIERDKSIDLLQRDIDEASVKTLARRQPMAEDLRVVVSAIRISNDLERVGDLAKNIARRSKEINGQLVNKGLLLGLQRISDLSLSQLNSVLDAMNNRDADVARAVWLRDDEIDDLYTSLFRELLTYMMEDPRKITFCTHLLFCAKNIERMGDHATNIAETVIYMVKGKVDRIDRTQNSILSFAPGGEKVNET